MTKQETRVDKKNTEQVVKPGDIIDEYEEAGIELEEWEEPTEYPKERNMI